jgi:hypothetical protein
MAEFFSKGGARWRALQVLRDVDLDFERLREQSYVRVGTIKDSAAEAGMERMGY